MNIDCIHYLYILDNLEYYRLELIDLKHKFWFLNLEHILRRIEYSLLDSIDMNYKNDHIQYNPYFDQHNCL